MKNLLLVLSLVITASPAFATRARLEALGENKNGSYFIGDDRNIFLNPAAINNYKKKVWLETGTASAVADTSAAGKTQGGFTNTFGDFTYGVYVGKESDRTATALTFINPALGTSFLAPDHAFDFFFGGDAGGMKYGANIFYAGASTRTVTSAATSDKTSSQLAARFGITMDSLAIFTTVGISSKLINDTHVAATREEYKGKLNLDLGVSYAMDDMTYWGKFTSYGADTTQGTTSPTITTFKTMAYGIGAGWKKEATKSLTVFSRLNFDYQKNTIDQVIGATPSANFATETWYNFPLSIAAEAQATSWLAVRGSISHSLFGQHHGGLSGVGAPIPNDKDSLNDKTTVAMGFGLMFGDLTIDALAGQSAAIGQISSESSQGDSQNGNAFGFGNAMLSRVSMTYNF